MMFACCCLLTAAGHCFKERAVLTAAAVGCGAIRMYYVLHLSSPLCWGRAVLTSVEPFYILAVLRVRVRRGNTQISGETCYNRVKIGNPRTCSEMKSTDIPLDPVEYSCTLFCLQMI